MLAWHVHQHYGTDVVCNVRQWAVQPWRRCSMYVPLGCARVHRGIDGMHADCVVLFPFFIECGLCCCWRSGSLCPAGLYSSSSGSAACSGCVAGTYSSSGSSSCTQCDVGSISGANATACVTCAPGTFSSSAGSTACTSCTAGVFSSWWGVVLTCRGQVLSKGPKWWRLMLSATSAWV